MNGNHWTVFNSGGAAVADNLPLTEARDYLTPERFARGWRAVFCIVIDNDKQLSELEDAALAAERERCAQIAEGFDSCDPKYIAAAIRGTTA